MDVGVGVGRLFQAEKTASKRLGWFSVSSARWQVLLFSTFKSVLDTSGCSESKYFMGEVLPDRKR